MVIKVLIVIDTDFRFAEPASTPDFTFATLVATLTAAGMQVTKAHLGVDATADISNFHFDTSVNLLDFDALWLISHNGRNSTTSTGNSPAPIPDNEVQAIARYMAAGGGVFATGDHDSLGSVMCGTIPRVRAMRSWYGVNDGTSNMPSSFPVNFPVITAGRADTTQRSPNSNYGGDTTFDWFENQSDSVPQPVVPVSSPAHPILRRNDADILIYPDHMHEGNTQGDLGSAYDYTQTLTLAGQAFPEFPQLAGHREVPAVIATSQTNQRASKYAASQSFVGSDGSPSDLKSVNSLSVYEGRVAGVGRIVTGSTFHHYIDINLTGDSSVVAADGSLGRAGADAAKGQGFGFAGAEDKFATIKQVYVNITNWIARPAPTIGLILERSTFSKDEATANANFEAAILVTVDGLKPSQFPGGGITTLSPSAAQLLAWAPTITPANPAGITITPTQIASDDPSLADRLQRFTVTYRVTLGAAAFTFGGAFNTIEVDASLTPAGAVMPLTDRAWVQLVQGANPFELDLANNNTTTWLSSDLRVFPVVADGGSHLGQTLPDNATRAQALQYLHDLVNAMTIPQFEGLNSTEPGSALSPFPQTTGSHKNVYNFAIARVRLNNAMAAANNVRVFFRIVPSPTTAALTYHESAGVPTGSYLQTAGANPIALPGTDGAATQWLSFPCFASARFFPPATQTDADNVKPMGPTAAEISTFYGALIDNNLTDPYLAPTPAGGAAVPLSTLLMGEHQCLVAQIVYAAAPIPDGAQPATSDKLAQRNLAFSPIANPGLDASRMAVHTFEIEAAPNAIAEDLPPDELLLDWRNAPPEGTEVRLIIPTWDAGTVVTLADRSYARHEIRKVDDRTIAIPGGGIRYVPIPRTLRRQTGVIAADFPLGVKRGQRFDLSVRQVTNRIRRIDIPVNARNVTRAEALRLLEQAGDAVPRARVRNAVAELPRGVFTLGQQTLITDLRVLDDRGDHAVLIDRTPADTLATARRQSGVWRETIGAFQLGVPVSTKGDMLLHHLRLLSVLRWRAEALRPTDRWHDSFRRYVELIVEKVKALGGNPYAVPPTVDGNIPLPCDDGDRDHHKRDDCRREGHELECLFGADDDGCLTARSDCDGNGKARLWRGRVSALLFDHFGDFEGFMLEAPSGLQHRFASREAAILDLARTAWRERSPVTVATAPAHPHRVWHLIIGR